MACHQKGAMRHFEVANAPQVGHSRSSVSSHRLIITGKENFRTRLYERPPNWDTVCFSGMFVGKIDR